MLNMIIKTIQINSNTNQNELYFKFTRNLQSNLSNFQYYVTIESILLINVHVRKTIFYLIKKFIQELRENA